MAEERGGPAKISDLIQASLKGLNLEVELKKRQVLELWEEVVGPELALRTQAVQVQNQTLFVKVISSTWMQELQSQNIKGMMIKALNDRMGLPLIGEIKFVQGSIEPPSKPAAKPSGPSARPLSRQEKSWIREMVSAIKDKELRKVLQRVIARQLQTSPPSGSTSPPACPLGAGRPFLTEGSRRRRARP